MPDHPLPVPVKHPEMQDIITKNDLSSIILGRVTSKSSIINFASVNDKRQSFPIRFHFEITDVSGTVLVTVWNNHAQRYYKSVLVGDVVALTGYRIKISKRNEIELAINPSSPLGHIYKLTVANFQGWESPTYMARFPPLNYSYQLSPLYNNLPDDTFFDLCGRLQYVGPIYHSVTQLGYFRYRFLRVVFSTKNGTEFLVKMYSCSQVDQFEGLNVGQIIKVGVKVSSMLVDSASPRLLYTTTGLESQITLWNDQMLEKKKITHPVILLLLLLFTFTYTILTLN
jgi:hypothetical protein